MIDFASRSPLRDLEVYSYVERMGEILLAALLMKLGKNSGYRFLSQEGKNGQQSFYTLFCNVENEPVGFVQLGPTDEKDGSKLIEVVGNSECYSIFIYIDPSQRGRGYLNSLYRTAVANLKNQNLGSPLYLINVIAVPKGTEYKADRSKIEHLSEIDGYAVHTIGDVSYHVLRVV